MNSESNKAKIVNALTAKNISEPAEELRELWDEILRQRDEIILRQKELEEERAKMLAHLGRREKELENQSSKMRKDFSMRENILGERIRKQEESLAAEREANQKELEQIRIQSQAEIAELQFRRHDLMKQLSDFEDEKKRYDKENNLKLQSVSAEFVGGVVADLKDREKKFSRISFWWSVVGGLALVLSLISAGFSLYQAGAYNYENSSNFLLIYQMIKGALFLAVSIVLARYAFLMAKKYLTEALRVSDTVHSVTFGQLYVQSYGATAGWDQVKEAFSNWHPKLDQFEANESLPPKFDTDELKSFMNVLELFSNLKGKG